MEPSTHPAHQQGVKIPTVGRQVHYFTAEQDIIASANGAKKLPATVVQEWGKTLLNLSVMTADVMYPVVVRFSVPHKSEALPGQHHWDWPVIIG